MNGNYQYSNYFDNGTDPLPAGPIHDSQHVMIHNGNRPNNSRTKNTIRSNVNAGDSRFTAMNDNVTINVKNQQHQSSGFVNIPNAMGSVSSLPGMQANNQHHEVGNGQIHQASRRPRSRSMSFKTEKKNSAIGDSSNINPMAKFPPANGLVSSDSHCGHPDNNITESSEYLPQISSYRATFEDSGSRPDNMILMESFNTSNSTLDIDPSNDQVGSNGDLHTMGVEKSKYHKAPINAEQRANGSNASGNKIQSQKQVLRQSRSAQGDGQINETVFAKPNYSKLEEIDFVAPFQNSGEVLNGLISPIPDQRRNIVAKRGSVFTLMVAGESGLGKSTLINTLFGDRFEETNKEPHHNSMDASLPKTTHIEVREAIYTEKGFPVKFTVIDTPGFGDYTNNTHCWVPIVNYIDNQHKLYMLQEEQPDRRRKVDTRVHACLYFIRPSGKGLLPLDVKVMQELSTRVNLIPVLAKADSFTLKDREYFKQQV